MQYSLVRSKRKTLALTINRDGALTVRAPLATPKKRIDDFLSEKQRWIEQTRARMVSLPPPKTLTLADGEALPFLGETLTLRLWEVRDVTRVGSELAVPVDAQTLAPVLRWLDKQARTELAAHVAQLSQALALRPQKLRLSRAKCRWGSMSARGTLSLNRALLLCPPEVIDYVIVHELCHIPHPNHSPTFWAHVERCMPAYRTQRAWLKVHASLITFLPD
ncbi:MAG: M48 family metallopeptidase [Eubacteriales bacterium]|nr:M48 family metallopeptidase [Eubacteriales bacterium]